MKTGISIVELKQLLKNNTYPLLIDVRSNAEYAEKHIPLTVNFPLELIEAGQYAPEADKTIITVCTKGGGRSERAATYIRKNNSNTVFYLEGGTLGWFENGH
jgi:rhodanese-related sulfurtransferase